MSEDFLTVLSGYIDIKIDIAFHEKNYGTMDVKGRNMAVIQFEKLKKLGGANEHTNET